jgi:hypothetical protein
MREKREKRGGRREDILLQGLQCASGTRFLFLVALGEEGGSKNVCTIFSCNSGLEMDSTGR